MFSSSLPFSVRFVLEWDDLKKIKIHCRDPELNMRRVHYQNNVLELICYGQQRKIFTFSAKMKNLSRDKSTEINFKIFQRRISCNICWCLFACNLRLLEKLMQRNVKCQLKAANGPQCGVIDLVQGVYK